jgi:hypothetical protein
MSQHSRYTHPAPALDWRSEYPRESESRKPGYSLQQMEDRYRAGFVTDAELDAYLMAWNATPGRFTHAYWMDGAIRQREVK